MTGMMDDLAYLCTLRSVQMGNEKDKTKLAYLLLSGIGGAPLDAGTAVSLLEERVKDADDEALWMLGLCYEFGNGVEQDIDVAEKFYALSRYRGNVIGEFLDSNGDAIRGSGMIKLDSLLFLV